MFFKKQTSENLRLLIPVVAFLLLTLYLLTADPGIVGPY